MDNPTNRYITAAAIVLVSIATASLTVSMAVLAIQQTSGDRHRTVHLGSERTLVDITHQLEVLQAQLNKLEEGPNASTEPRPEPNSEPLGPPEPASPSKTHTPQPTLRPTPTPFVQADAGPGICQRHPQIQQTLINKLNITSCRLITNEDLFRVTSLDGLTLDHSPQPGDFAGLTNLRGTSITLEKGSDLHADTFHGLANLRSLHLNQSQGEMRRSKGQRQQLGVVNIGSSHHCAQRPTSPVNQDAPLAARLGPVRRVGAD